ncbi:hypothetical protein ABH926_006347 [Catenulispora sp. GP43]|uniref:NACHT domain-containing protein n=1 Tax=Catenulispora sp. GP43 TaxID=3156263 RepID=UPI003511C1FE
MGRELGYADAVKLLGGVDSRVVAALDRLTGGLLLAASVSGSTFALNLFEPKGELARLSGELVTGLADRMRGLGRFDRTQRLVAAHKVVVITAYFEALSSARLPFSPQELSQTAAAQVSLATGQAVESERLKALAEVLLESTIPGDAPRLTGDPGTEGLRKLYGTIGMRLMAVVEEATPWSDLDPAEQGSFRRVIEHDVPTSALSHYEGLLRRLAAEYPEVAFWSMRLDHAAISEQIAALDVGLAGVERFLKDITSERIPDVRRDALVRRYRKALKRPIMEGGDIPDGLAIPSLADAYINPRFRAVQISQSLPIDREDFWEEHPIREDLQEYLISYLTTVGAATHPLILLGQPGSGKSVLTKILAAHLPAADFLTVRVVLREVLADTDLQAQVEHAIRAETGESLSWPALARSAAGAMPVLLLDGFDELLQATGIGQSDYLEQVARFQEREADQGRPVAVVVTSRTAVADRARIPSEGAMVVRLEPFADEQVRRWLAIWNSSNAAYFEARKVLPLAAQTVLRQPVLTGQPLLLMMLALYDAGDNALRNDVRELEEADLYERLLISFAQREVRKTRPHLNGEPLNTAVESEFLRLSVVAFSMFNRGRQWAAEVELSADLSTLLHGTDTPPRAMGFHEPATPAQIVISHFFFIHQAQAIRSDKRLTTCEFLHATFGEYLIARLTAHELSDLCTVTALPMSRSRTLTTDGFLRALLSFAPLTMRSKVVEFLTIMVRRLPAQDVARLRGLLTAAFQTASEPATDLSYEAYRPSRASASAMHAAYSANLLVLLVLLGGPVTGRDLFPDLPYSVQSWRRQTMLWRSQFTVEGWRSLTRTLQLDRIWAGNERDIALTLAARPWLPPHLEGFWIDHVRRDHSARSTHFGWGGGNQDDLRRESYFTCDLTEDIAWHGLEPIADELATTTQFARISEDDAVSNAHAMIRLWLASSRPTGAEALELEYENCLEVIDWCRPPTDTAGRDANYVRVLRQMAADKERLSMQFLREARDRFRDSILRKDYLDENPLVRGWAAQAFADLEDDDLHRGRSSSPAYYKVWQDNTYS